MQQENNKNVTERNIPGMMSRGQRFAEVQHAENIKGTLKRVFSYFVKEKVMVFGMLAVVIFGTLCGIVAPGIQSNAIDIIAKSRTGSLGATFSTVSLAVSTTLFASSAALCVALISFCAL